MFCVLGFLRAACLSVRKTKASGLGFALLLLPSIGASAQTTLDFSPATLEFGNPIVGTTVYQLLRISNTGTAAATFSSFTIGGPNANDFAITSNQCALGSGALPPAASCQVSVSFTPSTTEAESANLTIVDNGSDSPQVIALGGLGNSVKRRLVFQYLALGFGTLNIGVASPATSLAVTNTGNTVVDFSSIAITGRNAGDFSISSNTCNSTYGNALPIDKTCSVAVMFTPAASGARSASLTFTDDASGSQQSIPLTGSAKIAAAPSIVLSPTALNWAYLALGNTLVMTVSAANGGITPVTFSATIAGPNADQFYVPGGNYGCGELPAGYSCDIPVYFSPTIAAPNLTANLVISSGNGDLPLIVPLVGSSAFSRDQITANLQNMSFGGQYLGNTSSPIIATLSNSGPDPLPFGFSITGPNPGDYIVTQNQCSSGEFAPHGSCTIAISFAPSATGLRSASLNISSSNAFSVPSAIPLTGVGLGGGQLLDVLPRSLAFSQIVGSPSPSQTVTLANAGPESVTFTSIAITGPADYAIRGNNCPMTPASLSAGSFCSVQIAYTPASAGQTTATLGIVSSAGTQAVSLKGSGQNLLKKLQVPAFVSFNPQSVSGTSLPLAVTIQNTGAAPIDFAGFAITGSDATEFSIASNSCPAMLAASDACTLGLTFAPAAAGRRTAALAITDDVAGSPQSIPLSGIGEATQSSLQVPAASAFGPVNVGATSALTIVQVVNTGSSSINISSYTVSGPTAADFTIAQNACTTTYGDIIPPGANCSVSIVFTPASTGLRTASLKIVNDGSGSPETIALTGVGQGSRPSFSLSPDGVSFGTWNMGSASAAQTVTITNAGDTTLLFSYSISGTNASDFAISGNECTSSFHNALPMGASCTVTLQLTPSAPGVRIASLKLTDDSGSYISHSIPLEGSGLPAQNTLTKLTVSASSYYYGLINVGARSSQTFGLSNKGTTGISFAAYPISGQNAADFTITANTCSSGFSNVLPAGHSCLITITFVPSAAGGRNAAVSLTDTTTQGTQAIVLAGAGHVIRKSVDFEEYFGVPLAGIDVGTINVGNNQVGGILLVNNGDVNVTIGRFSIAGRNAGDFQVTYNYCTSVVLAPANYCQLAVSFVPSAVGVRTANLSVIDDAAASPQSILLTGLGAPTTPNFAVWPTNLVFTSAAGMPTGAKPVHLTDEAAGFGEDSITQTVISGPNASDFSVVPNVCNHSILPSCELGIQFKPSDVGLENAKLTLTDNTGETYLVNLVGLGQTGEKALIVSNDYLEYSNVSVGSLQTDQFTLGTVSNSPVMLSSLSVTGPNAAEFTASAAALCKLGALIPAAGCDISVQFAPSAAGLHTATLQLVDNATGATQDILLIGNGSVAAATVSASPASFGLVPVNTTSLPAALNFRNNSTAAVSLASLLLSGPGAQNFNIVSTTCAESLAANASCQANVTFSPAQAGPQTAALQLPYSGGTGSAANAVLGGDGSGGAGYIAASTLGIEFDDTVINTAAFQIPVTLTNTGQGVVHFSGFTLIGLNAGDFSIYGNDCPSALPPSATCTVNLRFTPTAIGVRAAALQISGDASNTPQVVGLAGVGDFGNSLSAFTSNPGNYLFTNSPYLDFGFAGIGSPKVNPLPISLAAGGIDIKSIQVTGPEAADFTIASNTCGTVLNSTCQINIQFAPLALGIRTANLVVTSNAVGSPLSIQLSGVGESDYVFLQFAIIDFGIQTVGTSSAVTNVNVEETSGTEVHFGPLTLTGPNAADFTASNGTCTYNASTPICQLMVSFAPTGPGPRAATLLVNDDAPGSPQKIALTGTAVMTANLLSPSTATLDFGIVDQNVLSKTLAIVMTNKSGHTVSFGDVSISGTNASDFQIAQNYGPDPCISSVSFTAGANTCNIYVQFTPSTNTSETATLVLNTNPAPTVVTLVGAGQAVAKRIIARPVTLDFGTGYTGVATSDASVTIMNSGDAVVNFGATTILGAQANDFAIDQNSCTGALAPGASCAIAIRFTASVAGLENATLHFGSDATLSPVTVPLTGTGVTNP